MYWTEKHFVLRSIPFFAMYLLFILTSSLKLIQCQSQNNAWSSLNINCFTNEVSAVDNAIVRTEILCIFKASMILDASVPVAQFNKISGLCTIFASYQSVCRFTGNSADCLTFVRFPVTLQSIYAKLNNLWVADGSSKLENLVCQIDKDTNRFVPVNTVWTSEGLRFDSSIISHMVLNQSSIGFPGGITWLLKLKRTPQVQPFLEFVDCSTLALTAYSGTLWNMGLWEYTVASRGHVWISKATGASARALLYTNVSQFSSSADEWIKVAFVADTSLSEFKFYYGNAFVPMSIDSTAMVSPVPSIFCAIFGRRIGDPRCFNGTLRTVAVANVSLSETEIQQFFLMAT